MSLDRVPAGAELLLDAAIFIYHFTGNSNECRRLLARCEAGELKAVTTAVVLAEVAHRLMTIEARAGKLVTAGNVVAKLREHPEVVKQLHVYQEQIERIPMMGVKVLPVEHATSSKPAICESGMDC